MGSIVILTMHNAITKEVSINLNSKAKKKNILNSIKSSISLSTISLLISLIVFFQYFGIYFQ